jgi:hypothetical protein
MMERGFVITVGFVSIRHLGAVNRVEELGGGG